VAIERTHAGKKVVLVNAASAYHAGGGFITGGRHTLEESLCTQSTLFQSLEVASRKAEKGNIGLPAHVKRRRLPNGNLESWHCHIPAKGAILSPGVEFFRAGPDQGYGFLREAVQVCCIVSVAMPNCGYPALGIAPKMRDCPVDISADMCEYRAILESKCSALCAAAVKSGATVLVLPDVGCGVYGNPARDVGNALGRVLGGVFRGAFEEVHFVGTSEFQAAVTEALALPVKVNVVGIKIIIKSACNLRNSDLLSLSDPFCICTVKNKTEDSMQLCKTGVIKDNLNPEWDYTYHTTEFLPGPSDSLEFLVEDKDLFGSEPLGKAVLNYLDFFPDGFDGELQLEDSKTDSRLQVKVCLLYERCSGS